MLRISCGVTTHHLHRCSSQDKGYQLHKSNDLPIENDGAISCMSWDAQRLAARDAAGLGQGQPRDSEEPLIPV